MRIWQLMSTKAGLVAVGIGAIGSSGAAVARAQDSTVKIRTYPERPLIERGKHHQYLNFDFALENSGSEAREIERIDLSIFDRRGKLVRRQFVWSKGAASPGFLTVPDRVVPARGSLSLFNPFYELPSDVPLDRLQYVFVFGTRGIEPIRTSTIEVRPAPFQSKARLILPVDGPAIVYDGHDFYSHHRRIPLGSERMRRAGFEANPVRYANDLTPVGPNGELARGSLAEPESWFAYGAIVRAPAAGVVVSALNDVPDNRIENGDLVLPPNSGDDESRASLGNHVIVEQAPGEYSVLAHLKMGSVRVKRGDRVAQGQVVGAIGFSGDTGFHVHLHHNVTATPDFKSEGMPIYFDRVRRVTLPRTSARDLGPILQGARLDTGDLIQSAYTAR